MNSSVGDQAMLTDDFDDGTEQFALTEASYVTVRFLQCFETITAHDDREWVEQYSLVMCSMNGVQASVTRPCS